MKWTKELKIKGGKKLRVGWRCVMASSLFSQFWAQACDGGNLSTA